MPNWLLLVLGLGGTVSSLVASTQSIGAPTVGAVDLRQGLLAEHRPGSHGTSPKRILSTSLLSDELLLDLVSDKQLIGVSYVIDWPDSTPDAGRVPKRIPRTSGKTEDIIVRQPDLVVLSAYNNALTYAQLKNLGLDLFVIKTPQSFEQLFVEWQRLGDAVGRSEIASVRIKESKRRLKEIRAGRPQRAERPRALLLQGLFSYGPETLQGDALRQAGFSNVLSEVRGPLSPQLNTEQVLALDPEYIFIAAAIKAPRPARPQDITHYQQLRYLSALREGRACAIPGAWMASISHHALLASRAYAACGRFGLEAASTVSGRK